MAARPVLSVLQGWDLTQFCIFTASSKDLLRWNRVFFPPLFECVVVKNTLAPCTVWYGCLESPRFHPQLLLWHWCQCQHWKRQMKYWFCYGNSFDPTGALQRFQRPLGVCRNTLGTASLSCKIGNLRILYVLPKHVFSCVCNHSDWSCGKCGTFIVRGPNDFSSYLDVFSQKNPLWLWHIFVAGILGLTMKTIGFVFGLSTFFVGLPYPLAV